MASLVARQAKLPIKLITSVVFNFQYVHRKKKRMVYLDPLGTGAQSEETFRVAR